MKSIFVVFFDIAIHGQIQLLFHNDMKKNCDRSSRIDIHSIRLKKLSNLQERENVWKSCLIFNKVTDEGIALSKLKGGRNRNWKVEGIEFFVNGEILTYIICLMAKLFFGTDDNFLELTIILKFHKIQQEFKKSFLITWYIEYDLNMIFNHIRPEFLI